MLDSPAMQRKHYAKEIKARDASDRTISIVVSRFNEDITERMLAGALETLAAWKVRKEHITIVRVPGSFEIPYGCLTLLKKSKKPDAIIALGCIIKGETEHDRYLATAASQGIMRLSIDYRMPIAFGIITTNSLAQAKARSSGPANKGKEAALAALESAFLAPTKRRA